MTLSAELLTSSPLLDADEIEGEIGNLIYAARRGSGLHEVQHNISHSLDKPDQALKPCRART